MKHLLSRLSALRRLPRRDPRQIVSRHPRLALGGLVGLVFLLGTGAGLLGSPPAPSSVAPNGVRFDYTATWTLLDLQRHVDAGEVVAISTPTGPLGANGSAPSDATADPDTLVAKLRDGQLVRVALTVPTGDAVDSIAAAGGSRLLTTDAWQAVSTTRALPTSGDAVRTAASIVVPLFLLGVLVAVVLRVMRVGSGSRDRRSTFTTIMPGGSAGGGGASSLRLLPVGDRVRLGDVAGCDEAKLELTEAIDFLTGPERFRRLGARIPRGIMLFGPPGTGKTMLAKAVATEAGVPFLYASGSEFVEKYVGVGARRIRDLFVQARQLGRAVVFFDEFDALGKARGGTNSHEEREQTLNQLLVELDGFASDDEVVVIAATNRVDILDPAVLRPGRFSRKIHVGLPDVKGRRAILDVHATNKPIAADADLDVLARKTYGFSGAQLADLLNESAILAARREADEIGADDLHGGWLKVAVGTGRRRSMDERERSIIAAHEVGHAICGRVHGDKRKVEEISLFAHGEALGVTVSSQEDNDLPAESDLRARLVALMGGRAAEELLFHEVTGGASNDFDKANQIASTMVTRWGMGSDPEATELGRSGRGSLSFLVARAGTTLPSEVQAAATRAVRAILDEAYEQACETLVAHMTVLRRISAHLVEEERIDGETFEALFDGTIEVPNADLDWRPQAARPREWAEVVSYNERRRERSKAAPRSGVAEPSPVPAAAAAPSPLQPSELPLAAAVDADVRATLAEGDRGADVDPIPSAATGTSPVDGASGGAGEPAVRRPSSAMPPKALIVRSARASRRVRAGRRVRALAARHLQRAGAWLLADQ
ncbi:MAG TPA: AAA family ATPase [Candidatus Limnocylindrales bacterium]|nr:AAA family ATPase [Candidatus Limnocylindrales bacterium]